jgi:hypothetical protein
MYSGGEPAMVIKKTGSTSITLGALVRRLLAT